MGQVVNFCAGTVLNVLPARHVRALLTNTLDNASTDSAIRSTRRLINAAQPEHVILDSGGYPIHVAEKESKIISFDEKRPLIRNDTEINISPSHVILAAAKLKPNIVMALDFPIRKRAEIGDPQLEFMRKVGFNAIWAVECSELRKSLCPDVQLFVPVQCYDLHQFDQFMTMIPSVEYDGLSMPVRNLSNSQIILFLVRFYQLGIRQIHILGTSKLFVIAIAAYMARHYFDLVSFDATTWRIWAERSLYKNPYNLRQERIAQDVNIDESIQMDCECPFCKDKTFTFIKNLPETDRTSFLRGHNWWVVEKATTDLYQNSGNVIDLERCLRTRGADVTKTIELCKALSLADSLRDQDISILEGLLY